MRLELCLRLSRTVAKQLLVVLWEGTSRSEGLLVRLWAVPAKSSACIIRLHWL